MITTEAKAALLGKYTSLLNKMHLVIGWTYFKKWYIEWRWMGEPYNSRMQFRFGPEEEWVIAKSFEEDMLPKFKYGKEKNVKSK